MKHRDIIYSPHNAGRRKQTSAVPASRVACALLLSACLTGAYGLSAAWGAPDGDGGIIQGNSVTASGTGSSAWGHYAKADGEHATAWGNFAKASGKNATAFGQGSEASAYGATAWGGYIIGTEEHPGGTALGLGATAFGSGTWAKGTLSTAWGSGATASGENSTAWGYQTQATAAHAAAWGANTAASAAHATAWGDSTAASGEGATAWGNGTTASGLASTAFGDSSRALAQNSLAALGGIVETDADNSAAVGKGAKVTVPDTVALGSGSAASRTAGDADAYLKGSSTGPAWVSTHNAIAVGADGNVTRQLTGLAAGTKDTDAVNVAQLKAAAPAAGSGIAVSGTVISVSAGDDFTFTDGQLQLKKDGKVAADDSGVVTGGTVYQAMKDKADKATSLAGYGITDAYTRTETDDAISAATADKADKATTLAGYGITDAYNKTEVYNRSETDDAISSALAPVAETAAKHNTTIAGKNVTVTEGTNAAGGTEYTIATVDDMTLRSISITGGAKISKSGFAMNGAKITGLAEGTDDADAVTVKQLRESTSKAGSPTVLKAGRNIVLKEGKTSSGGLEYTVSTSDSPAFDTITAGSGSDKVTIGSGAVKVGGRTYVSSKGLNAGGQKITNVADGSVAKGSTDAVNGGQLWDLEQKINTGGGAGLQELDRKLTRDIREVGSRAAALAGLHPLPYDEDAPTTFNVAVGSYRGETSAAVGMSHHFTRDAMFSVGGTVGSRPMFNAGFALRLGRYDEKVVEARKRRRKETAEKNRLLGQVSAQNAQIDRQAAELAQVKRERDRDRMELEALRRRLDLLEQRLSQPTQSSRRRRNK